MVAGIRFPKQIEFSATSPTNTPTFNVLEAAHQTSTSFSVARTYGTIPIATARYSAVRKVVFHANVRYATVNAAARLRVALMSASANSISPDPVTIAPGSLVRTTGSGTSFSQPAFDVGHVFSKSGSTSLGSLPTSTSQIDGPTFTLIVEFDRFDPQCDDFFAVWDSQTEADRYQFFRLCIQRADGSTTASAGTFADVGVTIVQAPSANNRTVTLVPVMVGYINDAVMQTAYGTGYRGSAFRYTAANWDHITSVHMLTFCAWTNNSPRDFNVGLHSVATYEPISFNLLYEENFEDLVGTLASGDSTWCRSQDVSGFLVDGADHCVMIDNQNAGSISLPVCWLEIVQEGFTRTECIHDAGNQYRIDTTPTGYGSPATPPFDPQWYQSFPDERILSRRLQLAYNHVSTVTNTTIVLNLSPQLQANVIGLQSTDPFIQAVSPNLTATPTATAGLKIKLAEFSPDPIDLAGRRKLVFGITTGTGAGTDDLVGTARIIYALSVPNSETPELGPVFPLDAFNPEGCASTAAGLGDPGQLVITNGSTIPKKFDPESGEVQDCGVPAPFCEEPLPTYTTDSMAQSPAGGLGLGIYRYRYTFRNCCTGEESNPNGSLDSDDGDIVVDTSGESPAAEVTLSFANIRIPGDPQICEICVYRTILDGAFPVMAKVGCFDPSETELFVDRLADSELDFTNDTLSLLNAPMPCVPIVVDFKNRLFGMGDIPLLSPAGSVSVVNGSRYVLGSDDVEWNRCLEGRYLQVEGDCRVYEIECVMPPEAGLSPPFNRLKLVDAYEGDDATGKLYTVCGRPNRLYYSEPLLPASWPKVNFLDIEPGDGDRLMGGVSNFDSLVICKRRKTYVLRFSDIPGTEVNVPARVSSDIGCVAPRSFAQIESGSVWLADRGLAIFDGRGVAMVPECIAMNDLFTNPDNPLYVRRDSLGRVIGAVGRFYPKRQQYLLLLPTKETDRGANLLLVWDTVLRNITLHKFCQEFLSLEVAKDSDGNERVYAGDANGFVWILDIGDSDGVGFPGATGTVVGTVSGNGIDPLTGASYIDDLSATFIDGGLPGLAGLSGEAGLSGAFGGDDLGLAGVCLYLRQPNAAPDDLWTVRTIFAATTTRLFITPALTEDVTGWDYMIGAIDFRAEFKPTNFGTDDMLKRDWRQAITHEPENVSTELRVQLIPDFQNVDEDAGSLVDEDGLVGAGRTFDLSFSKGRQTRPVGRVIYNFEQVVLTNFAPESPVRLLNHLIMLQPRNSK